MIKAYGNNWNILKRCLKKRGEESADLRKALKEHFAYDQRRWKSANQTDRLWHGCYQTAENCIELSVRGSALANARRPQRSLFFFLVWCAYIMFEGWTWHLEQSWASESEKHDLTWDEHEYGAGPQWSRSHLDSFWFRFMFLSFSAGGWNGFVWDWSARQAVISSTRNAQGRLWSLALVLYRVKPSYFIIDYDIISWWFARAKAGKLWRRRDVKSDIRFKSIIYLLYTHTILCCALSKLEVVPRMIQKRWWCWCWCCWWWWWWWWWTFSSALHFRWRLESPSRARYRLQYHYTEYT